MKHLLLAALLATAAPALAQTAPPVGTEAAQPFKKANVIVLHTTDSTSVAYKKIAQAVLEAGYTIDRADKELGFINTKVKTLVKASVSQTVQASIKHASNGAVVEIRGTFSMPSLSNKYPSLAAESATEYRGMKGSPVMSAWEEIMRIATSYPGATLAYKKQL